jgi:2-phospho-L-lactate guanylyltransferase
MTQPVNAGLLPVKRLDRAKARLGPHFGETRRELIARALFADALSLCTETDFLEWWVLSDDDEVLSRAREAGHATLRDEGIGLNAALTSAMKAIAATGAESVTIIPADVPLARPGDLLDLLDTGATSDVVVVPSHDDGGTNGLFMRPVGLLEPAFGAGSLSAHVTLAHDRALRCSVLTLPGLALDIDTPDDVRALMASPGSSLTAEVCAGL